MILWYGGLILSLCIPGKGSLYRLWAPEQKISTIKQVVVTFIKHGLHLNQYYLNPFSKIDSSLMTLANYTFSFE